MKRPRDLWTDIRDSFWAVPTVTVVVAVALALVLIETGQVLDADILRAWPRLFGAGADGSRAMLSAIAGSMITVAGVVFSITIVALSLASSQYTSRVLRSFMRDRMNQLVLGVFVSIFAYCLVVLRTIRGGDEGAFVPSLAVLFAVALAFVGIGVLIFFIHHIGTSIQASHIIATVARETLSAVDRLFPEEVGESIDEREEVASTRQVAAGLPVLSLHTGYIQRVDTGALLEFARARGTIVRMERGVGEFIMEGAPLVSLPAVREVDPDAVRQINSAYTIDRQRTVDQDAGYGIRQLVDMALKGLSPGVNDVTTAMMCVDYLTAILVRLAGRRLEARLPGEARGARVITRQQTYADFVGGTFDQIRQNAEGNVAMLRHLLECLKTLEDATEGRPRRRVLFEQLEAVTEVIARSVESPRERDALESYARRVSGDLGRPTRDVLPERPRQDKEFRSRSVD
ncbi:MAG: DUF2254 domain-containing protein [Vicinamibacterales bacterium]